MQIKIAWLFYLLGYIGDASGCIEHIEIKIHHAPDSE
jgi:hypothetical protein